MHPSSLVLVSVRPLGHVIVPPLMLLPVPTCSGLTVAPDLDSNWIKFLEPVHSDTDSVCLFLSLLALEIFQGPSTQT